MNLEDSCEGGIPEGEKTPKQREFEDLIEGAQLIRKFSDDIATSVYMRMVRLALQYGNRDKN